MVCTQSGLAYLPAEPVVLRTVGDLRAFVRACRGRGETVALVPTMGALHDGHLTLAREGLKRADNVIVSIFVNPTQFGPHEDFEAYPRQPAQDIQKLSAVGAQAVFLPTTAEMYPEGASTSVHVKGITETLEGVCRPGHFDGVATIVTKLLLQALPDLALFGEKDYQQLQLIKQVVEDLNIPVDIVGVPIVRDPESGLALSSRNAYLSPAELVIAGTLNKTLFAMAEKIAAGKSLEAIRTWGVTQIKQAGFGNIDYLEIRDAQTLIPVTEKDDRPLRILVAAFLGRTRLIDNVEA